MSGLIGALRVSLSADTSAFEKGMKRSQRQAQTSTAAIQKSLDQIKGFGSGFLGALTVGALAAVTKKALDYAGSIAEVAQQLGVTSRDLQVFRYAAGQVGVSQEQLEVGLQKLTITLGKVAAGAKAPTAALKAIGVTADQLKGKDAGAAFRIIADGLQKVTDRSQRAAVEVALFGKSGASLDNLLSGGSSAINALSEAADRLGIVLSDRQIQEADETADKLEAVRTVLAANIASVVADNASSILGLASALGQLTAQVVRFLGANPQVALGIIGALVGGRVGGLPGAAAGALAGIYGGSRLARTQADANMDPLSRASALTKATKRYEDAKKLYGGGPAGAQDRQRARAEVLRQIGLAKQAKALAAKPAVQPAAGADISPFLAGSGPKAKKPKEDHSAERSFRNNFQVAQDERRAGLEILRAKEDLASDYIDRAGIQVQIIDAERADYKAQLDYEVGLNKLSKGQDGIEQAQADKLLALYDQADILRKQAIGLEVDAHRQRDLAELADQSYDHKRAELEAQLDIADTQAERRRIELELLRLAYEHKRQALQDIINTSKNFHDVQMAQNDLAALDRQQPLDEAGVMASTRGPWEQWQHDAQNTSEAMENLKVQGIEGAVNALGQFTEGWDAMKQAALSALKEIIAQLIRVQLMKLAASFLPGGGGMGATALGGSWGGAADAYASVGQALPPGFATGGGFNILGNSGTDSNMLSLNGLPIARVSHGERLSIGTDGGRDAGTVHIHVSGPMSDRDARRTGMQAAAGYRSEIARSSRKGF